MADDDGAAPKFTDQTPVVWEDADFYESPALLKFPGNDDFRLNLSIVMCLASHFPFLSIGYYLRLVSKLCDFNGSSFFILNLFIIYT